DIAIVAIDDETFSSLDMQWPFPRSYYAHMIDNLEKAGVKQIIFDIEFTETAKDPSQDMALAETAAKYNNVIFCGKLVQDNYNNRVQLIPPIQPITDRKLSWGIVNIYSDPDGFIRRCTLFEPYGDENEYSLGIAALANERVYQHGWMKYLTIGHKALTIANEHYKIPIVDDNKALINYYGPAKTFKTYSLASILDDSSFTMPTIDLDEYDEILQSGQLKGKTILVGATIDELHDNFSTPFNTSGTLTPGVEIHANFLEMVHHQDYLSHFPLLYFILFLFIITVLFYLVFTYIKPQISGIIVIILIIAYFYAAFYMFGHLSLIIPVLPFILSILLIYMIGLIEHYVRTNREKKFIKGAFSQYMAPELVKELLKNPKSLKYGGTQQEITVLFSDIKDFTPYTESHPPEETVSILHEFLTAMVDIILQNQGILDKFVGDEIMALYGTPVPLTNSALSACKTALKMQDKLKELNQKWIREGKDPFNIGIGINTGKVIVGNLGSQQIFDYTAIGDSINLGARLESLTRQYETMNQIIISEFTLEKVKDMVDSKFIAEVNVKGKTQSVKIYELLSIKEGF
ncbi:MAG TPA: adenylate/guanylate cyclase domain-containing protein, partial [Candidatus Cloacimonadota bacterium]|nr:adenylate/guanylate cyclase domain-containing protein [Candidatus Cloacimonadota bacterium]